MSAPLKHRGPPLQGGPLDGATAERLGSQQCRASESTAQAPFEVFAVRPDGRRSLYTRCSTRDAAVAVVAKLIAFGLEAEVAQ
jgi:hypothetical protein